MEVIEWVEDDKASEREIHWIAYYDTTNKDKGYNKTIGGEGGNTWELNEHKAESSAKMSQKRKGRPAHPNTIEAARNRKGLHLSDETKAKLSKSLKEGYVSGRIKKQTPPRTDMTGYHHTEESKQKMSQARKGKTYEEIYGEKANKIREKAKLRWTGKRNPNYKDVSTDEIIELIRSGLSNEEISLKLSISLQTIWSRLKSIGKTATELRKEFFDEGNV